MELSPATSAPGLGSRLCRRSVHCSRRPDLHRCQTLAAARPPHCPQPPPAAARALRRLPPPPRAVLVRQRVTAAAPTTGGRPAALATRAAACAPRARGAEAAVPADRFGRRRRCTHSRRHGCSVCCMPYIAWARGAQQWRGQPTLSVWRRVEAAAVGIGGQCGSRSCTALQRGHCGWAQDRKCARRGLRGLCH